MKTALSILIWIVVMTGMLWLMIWATKYHDKKVEIEIFKRIQEMKCHQDHGHIICKSVIKK